MLTDTTPILHMYTEHTLAETTAGFIHLFMHGLKAEANLLTTGLVTKRHG